VPSGKPPVNDAGQAPRVKDGSLLAEASCLLLQFAAAQGYVSFRAQYAGETVRRRLPEQCGVRILLRLRWDLLRRRRQGERAVLRPHATGARREPARANYHWDSANRGPPPDDR
jgi:hypothetical protein